MTLTRRLVQRLVVVVIVLCFGVVTGPVLGQQVFQSEGGAWSFEMPKGWVPVGFDTVRQFDQEIRGRNPGQRTRFVAGFTTGSSKNFTFPYVVVEVTDDAGFEGMSSAQLERIFTSKSFKNAHDRALSELVSGAPNSKTTFDRAHNRAVTTTEFTVRGLQANSTTYTFIGAHNMVHISCADLDSRGDRAGTAFDSFTGSFAFAPGYEFVSGPGAGEDDSATRVGGLVGSVVGLVVIGVIIRLIAGVFKKN